MWNADEPTLKPVLRTSHVIDLMLGGVHHTHANESVAMYALNAWMAKRFHATTGRGVFIELHMCSGGILATFIITILRHASVGSVLDQISMSRESTYAKHLLKATAEVHQYIDYMHAIG